jgi:radical SAM-linked protein
VKIQRLRFLYSLGAEATSVGQRDLVAAWEQACKAAEVPLAYSEGKRPSPLISVAAPLPQGVTSECELLDMVLSERMAPIEALSRIASKLPPGIGPSVVEEVGINAPSLQSQVRWADYEIWVQDVDREALLESICRLLEATTLPTEYLREKKTRTYDLRPLIIALELTVCEGETILFARLRAEPERTGRADQLAEALALSARRRIHRRRLALEEVSPALLACRRLNGDEA